MENWRAKKVAIPILKSTNIEEFVSRMLNIGRFAWFLHSLRFVVKYVCHVLEIRHIFFFHQQNIRFIYSQTMTSEKCAVCFGSIDKQDDLCSSHISYIKCEFSCWPYSVHKFLLTNRVEVASNYEYLIYFAVVPFIWFHSILWLHLVWKCVVHKWNVSIMCGLIF